MVIKGRSDEYNLSLRLFNYTFVNLGLLEVI